MDYIKEIEEAIKSQKKLPDGFAVIEILEGDNIEMKVIKLPVENWGDFGKFECIRVVKEEKIPSFRKMEDD